MSERMRIPNDHRPQGPAAVADAGGSNPSFLGVYRLARRAALLIWDGAEMPSGRRLRLFVDGTAVKPPISVINLPLADGRVRNVVALRVAATTRLDSVRVEDSDGRLLAGGDDRPGEFGLGRGGLSGGDRRWALLHMEDLLGGLEGRDRMRVWRFLLEVCPGLFHIGRDRIFAANVRRFTAAAMGEARMMVPRCRLPGGFLLFEAVTDVGPGDELRAVVVGEDTVLPLPLAPIAIARSAARRPARLLTIVPTAAKGDEMRTMVVFDDGAPRCYALRSAAASLPDATQWLGAIGRGRSAARARRYVLDGLAVIAADDDQAAALLRELQVEPARPAAQGREAATALSASADLIVGSGAGLFVAGRLDDPHGLVKSIRVERGGGRQSVPIASLHRFRHAETAGDRGGSADVSSGFAFCVADRKPVIREAPVRLTLLLSSGSEIPLAEGPSVMAAAEARDAVLAALPAGGHNRAHAADCLEATVRCLHDRYLASRPAADVVTIGTPPAEPRVSLIAPIDGPVGRQAALIRSRAAMLSADPGARDVELVHVLTAPQRGDEIEALLRGIATTHGLATRLVLLPAGGSAGAALNAGVAASRGADLVCLDPSAVPAAAGWLAPLLTFRTNAWQGGLVGLRGLHEDFSVCDEGLEVGVNGHGFWDLVPTRAGFPSDFGPRWKARRVAALGPGCVAIQRTRFERLDGFDEHFLGARLGMAAFCLKAGAAGLATWLLREPGMFRLDPGPAETAPHNTAALRDEIDRRRLERWWQEHEQAAAAADEAVAPRRAA